MVRRTADQGNRVPRLAVAILVLDVFGVRGARLRGGDRIKVQHGAEIHAASQHPRVSFRRGLKGKLLHYRADAVERAELERLLSVHRGPGGAARYRQVT